MTAAAHNESRGAPVCGASLPAVVLEKEEWLSLKRKKVILKWRSVILERKEDYQYFGVQSHFFTFLSAFRLMSSVWSLSCCFLRGASSPNSSTSLLTNRRTGR